MAGVPTGRGCDACRKQKKKCDQAKPACARCARLKIPCTGGGVKRFMFKSENSQAAGSRRPRALVHSSSSSASSWLARSPSNERDSMASALVQIIELQDPRYDISTYGWFVKDLPRHIGSSPPLDAAITAFVAGFNTLHNQAGKVHALGRYVHALTSLRQALQDPKSISAKGFEADDASVGLGAVVESRIDSCHGHLLQTILAVVVIESFSNPNVVLGPWLWQALSILNTSARPLRGGDGKSFASLDIGAIGEVSYFIREPDKYLYQIRCSYDLVQAEYPILLVAVQTGVTASLEPDSTPEQRRMGIRFQAAHAVMLTLAALLNRVLRSYDNDSSLVVDAERYCDEILTLAKAASYNRPIAASSIASCLTMAWAMGDYRKEEAEGLLLEYNSDFPGVDYLGDAIMVKAGFDNIDRRRRQSGQLLIGGIDDSFEAEETMLDTGTTCIIL
ncbi:hypothetical protein F66182_3862 [Fusarium sp. NRRL 66182]|nr:hypothetical protein F66182_3862 [Fusarium sp. NRRL 66182]